HRNVRDEQRLDHRVGVLAQRAVHAEQDGLAGAGLAHPDLRIKAGLGLGLAGDDSEYPARVLTARLAGRADGVVLRGLVGDDDQRQYHAGGGAANATARLGERVVDSAGGRVGQVDGHCGLPASPTNAAMRARPVPSARRLTAGPPSPPDTVPAWYKRPRILLSGRGSASRARLRPAWGTTAGHR